jgi:hypothetical protein
LSPRRADVTVVADAGMISEANQQAIHLTFITVVGLVVV